MGIDDRDYMHDRHRERQGQRAGTTWWNEGKARREMDKEVPPGSASWIGGNGGSRGGRWFDATSKRLQHRQDQDHCARQVRSHPARKWILLLWAVRVLFPAYRKAKRAGWFSDRAEQIPFPDSGTVTVNNSVDPRSATSKVQVTAGDANAVVQLFDRKTDAHVISVYVNRNGDASVPVSPGTYRIKIVEGDKWHGLTTWFGSSTTFETVVKPMIFTRRQYHIINLNRSPAGNLYKSINFTNPKLLN